MENELIEIRLAGTDIIPGLVRSKELADIIESVEEMIASLIAKNNPDIKKDEVIIGLTNIKDGSVRLRFSSSLQSLTLTAFLTIGQAITSNSFELLPSSTIKSLQKISSFSKKHNCTIGLHSLNNQDIEAYIKPDMNIQMKEPVSGETTIYGKILRVGGKKPKASVETIEGDTIYCDLDINLAKKLGQDLYNLTALSGDATWNAHDFKIESFTIKSKGIYENKSTSSATNELSNIIGQYFNNITDVNEFVSSIRTGELKV